MNKRLHFTSLGCSKNLVDSQVMLGNMGLAGFEMTTEPQQADVIIINTCSFVEAAKIESIDTILEMADYKTQGKCEALVVAGCLSQRYSADLEKELPEVDLFIGTGEYHKIVPLLSALSEGKLEQKSFVEVPKYIHTEFDPRMNTSPSYMAWLKVSEGCNRNCTFCIIPTLRGKLRSRNVDSLVVEAQNLARQGVKELNLISQDLSDYGIDLNQDLHELLLRLQEVEGIEWIRLFYYYPEDLSEKVMQLMAESPKICSYLDMPVQHFSDTVLRRMNRRATGDLIHAKIKRLREFIPDIILRTSLIVGFPGETQKDFQQLLEGIERSRFQHLGLFRYSDEEGTPAFNLQPKTDQEIIEQRFDQAHALQKSLVQDMNKRFIGKTLDVLIEGVHEETELLLQGRHWGQAPDIDGKVIINEGLAKPGDLIKVEITDYHDYDLVGRIL